MTELSCAVCRLNNRARQNWVFSVSISLPYPRPLAGPIPWPSKPLASLHQPALVEPPLLPFLPPTATALPTPSLHGRQGFLNLQFAHFAPLLLTHLLWFPALEKNPATTAPLLKPDSSASPPLCHISHIVALLNLQPNVSKLLYFPKGGQALTFQGLTTAHYTQDRLFPFPPWLPQPGSPPLPPGNSPNPGDGSGAPQGSHSTSGVPVTALSIRCGYCLLTSWSV